MTREYLTDEEAIAAWNTRQSSLREKAEAMAGALEKGRDTFVHYGDLHAAKPDPVKASRNYALACEMDTALAEYRTAPPQGNQP